MAAASLLLAEKTMEVHQLLKEEEARSSQEGLSSPPQTVPSSEVAYTEESTVYPAHSLSH